VEGQQLCHPGWEIWSFLQLGQCFISFRYDSRGFLSFVSIHQDHGIALCEMMFKGGHQDSPVSVKPVSVFQGWCSLCQYNVILIKLLCPYKLLVDIKELPLWFLLLKIKVNLR
jgi:hypothetical protein